MEEFIIIKTICPEGVARLPHGTGKVVRVCVFASGADAEAARIAGAEIVGAEGSRIELVS